MYTYSILTLYSYICRTDPLQKSGKNVVKSGYFLFAILTLCNEERQFFSKSKSDIRSLV